MREEAKAGTTEGATRQAGNGARGECGSDGKACAIMV
jgi:hypothetical protein